MEKKPSGYSDKGEEMIYSRFGSQVVKVLALDERAMTLTVLFDDSRTDKPETVLIADLKADAGISEIIERGKAANATARDAGITKAR